MYGCILYIELKAYISLLLLGYDVVLLPELPPWWKIHQSISEEYLTSPHRFSKTRKMILRIIII